MLLGSGEGLAHGAVREQDAVAGHALPREVYGYGPDNLRVYVNRDGVRYVHLRGVEGKLMGIYRVEVQGNGTIVYVMQRTFTWFGGRDVTKWEDRLGSVQTGGRYYPYGEEYPATGNDNQKFATYWRDMTGLDYAVNRYYASTVGRFVTPDPYGGSGQVGRPGSWNRYAYVEGDPVNASDPSGLSCVTTGPEGLSFGTCYEEVGTEYVGPGAPASSSTSGNGTTATPEQYARTLQIEVQLGQLTNCQAMARFADFAANRTRVGGVGGQLDVARDFGVLTPPDPMLPPGVQSSYPRPPVLFGGSTPSGYKKPYREGPMVDQGHHFAPYFQWGVRFGEAFKVAPPGVALTFILGSAIGELIQAVTGLGSINMEDYNLGRDAALFGAFYGSGAIPASRLGSDLENNFCDPATVPGGQK